MIEKSVTCAPIDVPKRSLHIPSGIRNDLLLSHARWDEEKINLGIDLIRKEYSVC